MKWIFFIIILGVFFLALRIFIHTIEKKPVTKPLSNFQIEFDESLLHSNLYSPHDILVESVSNSEIKLSWKFEERVLLTKSEVAPEYAIVSGFRIYRDNYWYQDVPKTQTNLVDDGLYPNEEYSYRISALTFDNKIEGQKSNAITVRTKEGVVKPVASSPLKITRYLAEGDSISEGQKALKGEGWVDQVGEYLQSKNPNIKVYNKSVSGSVASSIDGRIEGELKQLHPDFITVAVGVNDIVASSRDIGNYSMYEYKDRLRSIVKKAKIQGSSIMLLNISYIKCCQEKRLAWNKMVRDIAAENGVIMVDVSSVMERNNPNSFMEDDLHPNQKGHTLIAKTVIAAISK